MALIDKLTAIANAVRGKTGQSGKLTLDGIVDAINNLKTAFFTQSKTVVLSEVQQIVTPDYGVDGLSSVTVPGIDPTYVGSKVTKRGSVDLLVSGNYVTAPNGYYPSQARIGVPLGTAGTPSATRGSVSNYQIMIKPTVTNEAGYITSGTITGTAVTVKASDLVSGSETKTANGTYDVTNLAQLIVKVASGGSLPPGIAAMDFGKVIVSNDFTTSRMNVVHNLGVTPDFVLVFATANVATTYSMLWAMRSTYMGYRSSAYNSFMCYHGNSTTTTALTNSNSTTYGVSNLTSTGFQLASASSSYYWRAGTYRYIAIKFSGL